MVQMRLAASLALAFLITSGLCTQASGQQVVLVVQHGNLQTLANSECPNDPPAGADLGKFFSYDIAPYDEQVDSNMESGCGAASAFAEGVSRRELDYLQMNLSTEATLDRRGGASAHAQISFGFEIHEVTSYEVSIRGSFTNTSEAGTKDAQVFLLDGLGDTIHSVDLSPPDLDEHWAGELEPGRYSLVGYCLSSRVYRDIPGGGLFEDGTGTSGLSVTIQFSGATIVPTADLSFGELKARF
jgi:hypothetical protein